MGFFDFLTKATTSSKIEDVLDYDNHPGWTDNHYSKNLLLSAIAQVSPWASTGIRKNQEKTGEIPFVLKKRDNPKEVMALEEIPYLRDFASQLESLSFWHDLAGEWFLIADRSSPVRSPKKLVLAPAISMELQITNRWRYTPITPSGHSQPEEYEPWKIIHSKIYGWKGNDFRGCSPLQPLLETVSADKAVLKYFKEWAETPAAMSGILSPLTASTGGLSFAQSKQVANNVQKQLDNFTHTRRLLVLTGPMQYQAASRSGLENLDVPAFSKMTRQEILGALGVVGVMVGLTEDVKSQEGINAARKIYYEETIVPRCRKIGQSLQPLLDITGYGDLMVEPDFSVIPELNTWMGRAESAAFAIERLGWTPKYADEYFKLEGEQEELPDEPLNRFVGFDDEVPPGAPGGANPNGSGEDNPT